MTTTQRFGLRITFAFYIFAMTSLWREICHLVSRRTHHFRWASSLAGSRWLKRCLREIFRPATVAMRTLIFYICPLLCVPNPALKSVWLSPTVRLSSFTLLKCVRNSKSSEGKVGVFSAVLRCSAWAVCLIRKTIQSLNQNTIKPKKEREEVCPLNSPKDRRISDTVVYCDVNNSSQQLMPMIWLISNAVSQHFIGYPFFYLVEYKLASLSYSCIPKSSQNPLCSQNSDVGSFSPRKTRVMQSRTERLSLSVLECATA